MIILGTNSVYSKQRFGEEGVENEILMCKNRKKLKYNYIFMILSKLTTAAEFFGISGSKKIAKNTSSCPNLVYRPMQMIKEYGLILGIF